MFQRWFAYIGLGLSIGCGDAGSGAGSGNASGSAKPSGSSSAKATASAKPSASSATTASAPTASASATSSAATSSSAEAGAEEITEAVYLAEIEKFYKAIHDNEADCAKMAEALKAVKPSEEREKALDAWEKKAKADPEVKKRMEQEDKKLEAKYPLQAGMKKCGEDPAVKAIIDKSK